jgi:class 3 adenylate cyclase
MGMKPALARALACKDRAAARGVRAAPEPSHAPAAHPDGLSEREVEVLRQIAAGRSNQEIADALVLSVRTVERHAANIYAKIGAQGRVEAAAYALGHGLHVATRGAGASAAVEVTPTITSTVVPDNRASTATERMLATLLFTDIVGSTERAAALGDAAWHELKARHHVLVRRELARFRGREIDTAGDGFFVVFDTPARAVQCARAVRDAVRTLGLEIRAGLHFGEVETDGGGITGIAVHTGARVSAMAGAGQILVSRTVRDLVAGSGLRFTERGVHTLKGVPGEWPLFALDAG